MSTTGPLTHDGFAVSDEYRFARPSLLAIDFDAILEMPSLTTPFQVAQHELVFHFEEALCDNHNLCREFRATPFAPDPYRDDEGFLMFPNRVVGRPYDAAQMPAAFHDTISTMMPTNPWQPLNSQKRNRYSEKPKIIGKAPAAFQPTPWHETSAIDQKMRTKVQSQAKESSPHHGIRQSKPNTIAELEAEERRKPTHERYNTSVACGNCHRQKVRCDTKRPCGRCVESGREDFCTDRPHQRSGRKQNAKETQQQSSASGSAPVSSSGRPTRNAQSFEEMVYVATPHASKQPHGGASELRAIPTTKKRLNPDAKSREESPLQKRKKSNHFFNEAATTSRRSARKRSRSDLSISKDNEPNLEQSKKRVVDAGLAAVTGNIDEEHIERQFSFLPDNSDFFDKFPVIFNDSSSLLPDVS